MVVTLPSRSAKKTGPASQHVKGRDAEGPESNAQLFTDLYRSEHQRIFDFACRRVGPEVALEVVSETFLVAWRKFAELPEEVIPWLYRVASFEIANHRRRQMRHDQLHAAIALVRHDASTDDSTSDLTDEVAAAFQSLSEADQEILRLATWERVTLAEGASVLACSVSAYRMRLHRARLRLGRRVRQAEPEPNGAPEGSGFNAAFADAIAMTVNGVEVAL